MNGWQTIAGHRVGKGDDTIVLVKDDEKKDYRIRGRWYYVKKCKRADEMDGIVLADKTRDDNTMFLILARGEGCGKPHKLTKAEKKAGLFAQGEALKVGSKVLVFDRPMSWLWKTSDWQPMTEFFLHECAPYAVLED